MTILLVGGTGLLGSAIAEELAGRGEPLRALVRTGKNTARLRALGCELEPGDLLDQRTLRRVVRDARVVITTAQGDPMDRSKRMARIDGQGTTELIRAAAAAGVEHFVFISALKADEGAARVAQLAYKHAAEQALQASGMRYTIIRPSSYQETFGDYFAPFKRIIDRAGVGLLLGRGTGRHSFVAVRDVARATRIVLDRTEAHNAIIPIGGPEDLSYREAYKRIERFAHRRVVPVSIPQPALQVAGLAAAPLLPDLRGFFAFFAFFDRAGYTCITSAWLLDALGELRSFDQSIREMYCDALPDNSGLLL